LIGTKCDLEDQRKVSKEEGEEKSKNLDIGFFEVSKFMTLDENLFHLFLERILESKPKGTSKTSTKVNPKKECILM
jgi:hypothetical protein